jgi:hypothetical protein
MEKTTYIAQGAGDVAFAFKILCKQYVAGTNYKTLALTGLELKNTGGDENQLPARSIVIILDMALRRFSEKHGVRLEYLGCWATVAFEWHLTDFDCGVSRGESKNSMNFQDLSRFCSVLLCMAGSFW